MLTLRQFGNNLFTISSYLFGSTSTNGRRWEICISKNYQKRNTVETVNKYESTFVATGE